MGSRRRDQTESLSFPGAVATFNPAFPARQSIRQFVLDTIAAALEAKPTHDILQQQARRFDALTLSAEGVDGRGASVRLRCMATDETDALPSCLASWQASAVETRR